LAKRQGRPTSCVHLCIPFIGSPNLTNRPNGDQTPPPCPHPVPFKFRTSSGAVREWCATRGDSWTVTVSILRSRPSAGAILDLDQPVLDPGEIDVWLEAGVRDVGCRAAGQELYHRHVNPGVAAPGGRPLPFQRVDLTPDVGWCPRRSARDRRRKTIRPHFLGRNLAGSGSSAFDLPLLGLTGVRPGFEVRSGSVRTEDHRRS